MCRVSGLIKFNGIPSPLGHQNVQFSSGSNPGVSGKSHIRSESNPRLPQWSTKLSTEKVLSLIKSFNKWTAFGGTSKNVQMGSAAEGRTHLFWQIKCENCLPCWAGWGWDLLLLNVHNNNARRQFVGTPGDISPLRSLATINHNPPSPLIVKTKSESQSNPPVLTP